jgi:prepilin-type N-terminal cleavage/methylation domain-containing protein/prepilin-type processing-associated H-X9-DG protein
MKRWRESMRCEGEPSQPLDQRRFCGPTNAPAMGSRRRGAFSLLEMLMVIAILLILTTLYWGGMSGKRERKTASACQQNLEKIFMAMQIYANDFATKYPVSQGARTSGQALSLLVPKYTVDTSVFICPGSKDPALPEGVPFRDKQISYAYYMGRLSSSPDVVVTDRQVDTLAKTAGQGLFSSDGKPPGNNHPHGGNFLYCDGHMLSVPAAAPFPLDVTNGVVLLNP